MANYRAITNHEEWQVESPVPYAIGEKDLLKFSQEESVLFFLKKQSPEVVPAAISANPEEELTPETLQQGYIAFPEDPVTVSSGVQPMQGLGASVGQWNGQQSRVVQDFSPVRPMTSGLEPQIRTTSGLTTPPQFSSFIHPGLQRSFSTSARSDMMQGIPLAATPPGPYHSSLMPSHGYQSPVPNMGQQGIVRAAMSQQHPPQNLQQQVALASPVTMAAYPVTTLTQMTEAGAIQPGRTVPFASVAESSARQEVNQQHAQLDVPVPGQGDFPPRTVNHICASVITAADPITSQSTRTEAEQVTTAAVVCALPSPVPSLAGGDGARQSVA
ncbi:MAG: hypothetical protein G8D88_21710, partial [gamma proteobacterium symbiont of Ctena orbiculata]